LKKNIHYTIDEKNQVVKLLDEGTVFCEQALNTNHLYNPREPWAAYILNSLKAKELFKRNTHYIINEEGEIIIVDEFTGRTMVGRRWSGGLHQAVEAKENLSIQDENQTIASITYQNLFLLYAKLSGMTGTAKTEELEFENIYKLKVVPIPTHRETKRKDFPDLIYKNQYLKWQAVANECVEMNALGRPILIGTTTIEKSELLAALLREYGINYRLLNARPENVESESEIIAQAGCQGAVTISTNMAGRGTDIALGGNIKLLVNTKLKTFVQKLHLDNTIQTLLEAKDDPFLNAFVPFFTQLSKSKVKEIENFSNFMNYLTTGMTSKDKLSIEFHELYTELIAKLVTNWEEKKRVVSQIGGLHVVGTERHESRRIDNQLRGRSGRQGDPGSSRFFLSLDDKLLRLFGGDQIITMMQNVGLQDDTPIQSPILNQSLDSAQKKVEAYHFEGRKQLFEYDQALTMQRNGVYSERKRVVEKANLRDWAIEYGERSLSDISLALQFNTDPKISDFCIFKMQELLGLPYQINKAEEIRSWDKFWIHQFQISYTVKEIQLEAIEPGLMRELERSFILHQIDFCWKEHLQVIASLRDSISWRAYAQRNPLTDYKKESYNIFVKMLARIRHQVIYLLLRSKITIEFS
jgi:preprotein translocase subunit SecA